MSDQPPPALSFAAFVLSLASTAAIHFGDLPDPVSGERAEVNLDGAAQMIEILALLDQKTRGNLTAEERQMLEQVLYELRLRFVEASGAGSGLLSLKVTLLGTGTSHGVPAIGCDCDVCHSPDPHDRRTRPSILIETGLRDNGAPGATNILIDTSTDLRAQALAYNIRRVDAILFTHSHADHVLGLDEVRRYNAMQRAAIPCYADEATLADLRRMFAYIFSPPATLAGGIPQLTPGRIAGPFMLGGVEIVPVPIYHGARPILGFRIGSFVYLTDCSRIPDASWPLLAGVRVLVIDALRDRPHPTHFSVAEALAAVARIGPERAYFTHICHDLPHAATCARLPSGTQLAYDGQVLEVE